MSFLVELAHSQDVFARRVAVIGLAHTGARDLLDEISREDGQWYVRSAAQAALEEMEEQQAVAGLEPPPGIDQLPWLISWAASQGEGVSVGEAAYGVLRRAFRGGDANVRRAAAEVFSRAGRPCDVEILQVAQSDPDPFVSSAALEALAEISQRHALTIA